MIDRTDAPTTVPRPAPGQRTFLGRLRGDVRGNTLAMMAIALIPVAALAGSGVDTARLYVVKVRLQQACDAGVLAGRKFMTDTSSATLDATATAQAQTFFANNFRGGYMKTATDTLSFTPTKTADSQVAATASVVVPMTVMKMFAASNVTLTVACEARYDVADADIMMVLDTTGSMACAASETGGCTQPTVSYTRTNGMPYFAQQEKSTSKIKALRTAVLDFYDTVAGNADPSTHIRYGFVPYTSSVNAGAAIPAGGMLNTSWTYQSRRVVGDANDGRSSQTGFSANASDCTGYDKVRTPTNGWDSNGKAKYTTSYRSFGTCYVTTQPLTPMWRYGPWATDISTYVAGNAVQDPSQVVTSTDTWLGCIEERQTTAATTFDYRNLPADLDPDVMPTTDATRWKPMWPEQIWMRGNNQGTVDSTGDGDNIGGDDYWVSRGYATCGAPVQRLAQVTRAAVSTYLNAAEFRPLGGTYHDIGMIWGTRMLSPNGVFGADTAAWPGRSAPNRHLVFMTDGDLSPNEQIYGQYGVERYDQRIGGGDTSVSTLTARHYARFSAVCDAAKARNITVWVVAFGQSMTSQLSGCATAPSSTHAFYAANDADLKTAFKQIAQQVAMLRVSK